MRVSAALAAVAIALSLPAVGAAGEDENEENESVTRVTCLSGTAALRLQADDGQDEDDEDDEDDDVDDDGAEGGGLIGIDLRVDVKRPVVRWRLVLLHERRIVYQGVRRSTRAGHTLRYRRYVPDWDGRQTVAARLSAPAGRTCRMEATI
jgi:hypothetical protein